MPENESDVMIWRKSDTYAIARFVKKDQFKRDNIFIVKGVGAHIGIDWVTHWQNLPPKPKTKE